MILRRQEHYLVLMNALVSWIPLGLNQNPLAYEVCAFGSSANGTLRTSSKVELAVSCLPPERFFEAMGAATDILQRAPELVDVDEDTPFTR